MSCLNVVKIMKQKLISPQGGDKSVGHIYIKADCERRLIINSGKICNII